MKRVVPTLVMVLLVAACIKKPADDRRTWFVESYENSVIVVRHEGNTYKATCEVSRSFNNAESVMDPNDVQVSSTCELPIGLVGRSVQPLEAEQKDTDGWTVNMGNWGSRLVVRRWRDEHTPWKQEEFKITSVTRKR
jgi:hypothetical protein